MRNAKHEMRDAMTCCYLCEVNIFKGDAGRRWSLGWKHFRRRYRPDELCARLGTGRAYEYSYPVRP